MNHNEQEPDHESFIEFIQSRTLADPPQLSAEKRAQLHRALDEDPAANTLPWLWIGFASTATMTCLLLMVTIYSRESSPRFPMSASTPTVVAPNTSDWEVSDQISERLANARNSSRDLSRQFTPENKSFKSKSRSLKIRIERLKQELG
ncbi:MAG: hypothetical protein AAF571_14230 [Verrucomicrobiota bacterium]